MKNYLATFYAAIALGALCLTTGEAVAGCGASLPQPAGMKPMAYRQDGGGGVQRIEYGPFSTSAITGLWKFVFTAEGDVGTGAPGNALPFPNGTVVDAGFVTWHDDGTEIMNSGRAPSSGSFCMGVWKQIAPHTYRLNHWALSWIPDYHPGATDSWTQVPGGVDELFEAFGPTNIQETITLDRWGNSYTGNFTLTQYVNNGSKTPINDITGAPVAFVIVGSVSGSRITAD